MLVAWVLRFSILADERSFITDAQKEQLKRSHKTTEG